MAGGSDSIFAKQNSMQDNFVYCDTLFIELSLKLWKTMLCCLVVVLFFAHLNPIF